MADQPIGISFIPSAQNQANGPANLRNEGGIGAASTDLADAYKILSLRLPTVVGAQAPVAPSLLTSQGSQGLANGMNPSAALFAALIKSMLGVSSASSPMGGSVGDQFGGSPTGGAPNGGSPMGGSPGPDSSAINPGRLVPKIQLGTPDSAPVRDTSPDPYYSPAPEYGGVNTSRPQQDYKDVSY